MFSVSSLVKLYQFSFSLYFPLSLPFSLSFSSVNHPFSFIIFFVSVWKFIIQALLNMLYSRLMYSQWNLSRSSPWKLVGNSSTIRQQQWEIMCKLNWSEKKTTIKWWSWKRRWGKFTLTGHWIRIFRIDFFASW